MVWAGFNVCLLTLHAELFPHKTQPINSEFNFSKDFIYLFLKRAMEGEREGEKHQCVVASCAPPTGNLP